MTSASVLACARVVPLTTGATCWQVLCARCCHVAAGCFSLALQWLRVRNRSVSGGKSRTEANCGSCLTVSCWVGTIFLVILYMIIMLAETAVLVMVRFPCCGGRRFTFDSPTDLFCFSVLQGILWFYTNSAAQYCVRFIVLDPDTGRVRSVFSPF